MLKRIWYLPLALLMLTGCDAFVTDSFPGSDFFEDAEKVAFMEVMQDSYVSYEVEAQNRVIGSEDAFREIWNDLHANQSPVPELPEIDFSERMVILAVMGRQNNGGYGIQIEEVAARDGKLGVHVVKSEAGENCVVPQSLTNPTHIVTIPASDAEVTFYVENTVKDCNK